MTDSGRWASLVNEVTKHRDEVIRQNSENIMAILAGESATIFGQRAEFTVSWPDGAPFRKTDDEFRQWAASELASMRRQP